VTTEKYMALRMKRAYVAIKLERHVCIAIHKLNRMNSPKITHGRVLYE